MLASSHTSNSLMQEIWLSLINHNLLIFRLPAPCCKFLCSLAPFSTLSKTVTSGLQDSHQRNLSIFRPLFFFTVNSFFTWIHSCSVQFSSVAQLCPTLCNPMDCSKPGFPVHHQLPGTYSNSHPLSWWCHPTILSSVIPFSSCPQSFPASGNFQMSQFFASGGPSIGASASASVLPMNI